MRTEQIDAVGNQAVQEIARYMAAFRAEIVLNKEERLADGETLKSELRLLVTSVQAKFDAVDSAAAAATASRLQVEESIRALTATAAAAAAAPTVKDTTDPWLRGGQAGPRDASRERAADNARQSTPAAGPRQCAMHEDDTGSSNPPGISAAPAHRWSDSEWAAWGKRWAAESVLH